MKYPILFLIMFAAGSGFLKANEFTAKVVSVIDGNTVEIESSANGIQKIVFEGIDSPELEQEFGDEARIFLQNRITGKDVQVNIKGKDKFGNYRAIILIDGDDVREMILKQGLAWTQEKNPDEILEGYCEWARRKGRGLWKNPEPIAPWVFRRQQSMLQPKSS
jgi:micrococcal nuclease